MVNILSLADDVLAHIFGELNIMHISDLYRIQKACRRFRLIVKKAIDHWDVCFEMKQMLLDDFKRVDNNDDKPYECIYYANDKSTARFLQVPIRNSMDDPRLYEWNGLTARETVSPDLGAYNIELDNYVVDIPFVYYRSVTQMLRYDIRTKSVKKVFRSSFNKIRERFAVYKNSLVAMNIECHMKCWYLNARFMLCMDRMKTRMRDSWYPFSVLDLETNQKVIDFVQTGDHPCAEDFRYAICEVVRGVLFVFGFDYNLNKWTVFVGVIRKHVILWKRWPIADRQCGTFAPRSFIMTYSMFWRNDSVCIRMVNEYNKRYADVFYQCTHNDENYAELEEQEHDMRCIECGNKLKKIESKESVVTEFFLNVSQK